MRTSTRILSILLLSGFSFDCAAQYETFDFPGADQTYVTGMNDVGDFVGYYVAGGVTKGFAVLGSDTIDVVYPGSQQTYAHGISNNRKIVGKYNDSGAQIDNEGFLYDYNAQNYEDLTFLLNNGNYTQVTDINEDGCWAGYFRSATSAYLMRDCNGHSTDRYNLLPTYGTSINEWGDVAGYIIDGANYTSFIRTGPGVFTLINYPNNIKTRVFGMNDQDMVVGDFGNVRGFIYDGFNQGGSGYEEIIIPDAITVTPQDINNENQICGYFTDAQGTHGFFIRGYDIGFRPQPDAWYFPNEDIAMWPSDEWANFDYTSDPYLLTKYGITSSFPKTGPGALDYFAQAIFPSWPLMVEAFGEEQFYTEVNGVLMLRIQPFEVWKEFAGDWKGSCYGMGYSSLMYYQDAGAFHTKFPEMPNSIPSVYSQDPTQAVRDVSNKLQAYQASKFIKDQVFNNQNPTPIETLTQIKAMMCEDDPDYFGVAIGNTHGTGASHLLIPFKVEQGQASGWWDVFVYDSNHPNDTTRRIQVNKQSAASGGVWYYEAAGNTGQAEVEWGGPLASSGFKIAPRVSDHFNTPPIGTNIHSGGESRTGDYVTAYFSKGAEEIFTYGSDQLGYQNDQLVATTSNGVPYLNAANAPGKPIGYLLDATMEHTATISNAQDGRAYMSVTTEDGLLGFERFDATSGQTDEGIYGTGLTYINPDAEDKMVSLKSYATYQDAEYRFWINAVNCEQGAELHIEPINGNELIVTNTGAATSYDLTISILSATDASTFEVADVPFAEDGIHHIVPFWGNLNDDGIYITVDTTTVGVDDTLFLDNQALPLIGLSDGQFGFGNAAGNDELFIINSGGGILQWSVASAPSWLTVTSGSTGTEDGSVAFDISENTGPDRAGWLVINSNDVNSPDSVWVVQGTSVTVSVEEALVDDMSHVVYPNPVRDVLTIGMSPDLDEAAVRIMDVQGKVLETRVYRKGNAVTQQFQMGHYRAGVYLVEVVTGATTEVHKIIKQ